MNYKSPLSASGVMLAGLLFLFGCANGEPTDNDEIADEAELAVPTAPAKDTPAQASAPRAPLPVADDPVRSRDTTGSDSPGGARPPQ